MKPYDWQSRLLEKLRNHRTEGQLYLNSVVARIDHPTRLYLRYLHTNPRLCGGSKSIKASPRLVHSLLKIGTKDGVIRTKTHLVLTEGSFQDIYRNIGYIYPEGSWPS